MRKGIKQSFSCAVKQSCVTKEEKEMVIKRRLKVYVTPRLMLDPSILKPLFEFLYSFSRFFLCTMAFIIQHLTNQLYTTATVFQVYIHHSVLSPKYPISKYLFSFLLGYSTVQQRQCRILTKPILFFRRGSYKKTTFPSLPYF